MGPLCAAHPPTSKVTGKKVKVKADIALPHLKSYGRSLVIWDHSVTCHPTQMNVPRLIPAMQAGTLFTYPGGMKGRVDLAPRPGVELATFRS